MDIDDKIKHYAEIYNKAKRLTGNDDLSFAIVHEIAADQRGEMIEKRIERQKAEASKRGITEKQRAWLRGHGIPFDEGISREEASKLISDHK